MAVIFTATMVFQLPNKLLLNPQLRLTYAQAPITFKKHSNCILIVTIKIKNMKKIILTAIAICTVAIVSSSTTHENAKSIVSTYNHAPAADFRKDVGSAD